MESITVRLNAKLQPLDRGDIFEDPLDELLQLNKLGEVCGAGTQLMESGEVEFCDIEVDLHSNSSLETVVSFLEDRGAPKGSRLLQGGAEIRDFGLAEGLAVYLNGSDLPQETYDQTDVNHVYEEFNRLLGENGSIYSHWEGPTETALYMYGDSFETMKQRLADFLSSYPLCEKARVVQIA